MSQMAESSGGLVDAVYNLLYFGAFIAINLAFMNLLPVPALDGGRSFFPAAEWVAVADLPAQNPGSI